jgi:hypothetical protein
MIQASNLMKGNNPESESGFGDGDSDDFSGHNIDAAPGGQMKGNKQGKAPAFDVIPEQVFGQESLINRISRSQPNDPATRHDEKDIRATNFTGQNPYDLRTWSAANLNTYQENPQHGVNASSISPATRMSKEGMRYLRQETTRRKDGNLRRMQLHVGTGLYKNASQQPKGYDPQSKYLRPHISTGETVITPKRATKSRLAVAKARHKQAADKQAGKKAPRSLHIVAPDVPAEYQLSRASAAPKQPPPPPPPPQPQAPAPDPTPAPT